MTSTDAPAPVSVAVVNDYEVVVLGVHALLQPYADRVRVVELDSDVPVVQPVDVALYDTFSMDSVSVEAIGPLVDNANIDKLVLYTWLLDDETVAEAEIRGVAGVLSKTLGGDELVSAIERIHRGERVVSVDPGPDAPLAGGDWPGREEGLTPRQSEIIALIVQGLTNQEIVERTHLSLNTVKSYIRAAYWRMGVSSRSQAILWGIDHGFRKREQRGRVRLT